MKLLNKLVKRREGEKLTSVPKKDISKIFRGFADVVLPCDKTKVIITTEEKSELLSVMIQIVNQISDGNLTGKISFSKKLSPICRDIIAYMVNNDVYLANGKYYIEWNWKELADRYRSKSGWAHRSI